MIVNLKKPGMVNLGNKVTLKPGPNSVDLKMWKEKRNHPIIKHYIEEGLIVEEQDIEEVEAIGEDASAQKKAEIEHLKTLKVPQAKQLVEETTNVELLKAWSDVEDRNQVKSALKKQLEKLTEPAEKRDRAQTRQIVTGRGPEVVEVQVTPGPQDD